MYAKMTFSLGSFQMQRKVEPQLDRVLPEYSFGIHSFPQKLRSLESHPLRARENHRDDRSVNGDLLITLFQDKTRLVDISSLQ